MGMTVIPTTFVGSAIYEITIFESIAGGTAGNVTLPTGASIRLDAWSAGVDALASTITGGRPDFRTPVDAGGNGITATLDAAGAYTLSAIPTAYPVAIIYVVRVLLEDYTRWTAAELNQIIDIIGLHDLPTPVAGDVVYANAEPRWDSLVHPGAANRVLQTTLASVQWSGWDLVGTAGQTYTLGTTGGTISTSPGTLTVATTNTTTAAGVHTHAITSSSDPGAAASILATNASGYLEVVGFGIGMNVGGPYIYTDRFLSQDSTTLLGVLAAGAGNMAHTAASEGYLNTFVGYRAGYSITTGSANVALGAYAMDGITTGVNNVAIGRDAFIAAAACTSSVAIGYQALYTAASGDGNVGVGYRAAYSTNGGLNNFGLGTSALYTNITGNGNVAIGVSALFYTTGSNNIGIGGRADQYQGTGSNNVAIGYQSSRGASGQDHNNNTSVGYQALYAVTTGSNNICIGYQAGDNITTGSANVIIGYDLNAPVAAGSNQMYLGGILYGDTSTGRIMIGGVAPGAMCHIDQSSGTGAIPVLTLDQADADIVLMKIIGIADAASADRTLVAASDFGTPGALVGWVQVEIQDDGNRIADADYYMPLYAVPT